MSLNDTFRSIAIDMFEAGRTVVPDDIIRVARLRHPEQFESEADRLVRNAAKRMVTDILKSLSEDDESAQLSLPGLSLPSVIAIPDEDGNYIYKPTAVCNWEELVAGAKVRDDNVEAALAKRNEYRENVERLRPFMEGTGRLVHEGARELLGKAS